MRTAWRGDGAGGDVATCCVYMGGCSWDCTAGTAPEITPTWDKPISTEAHHICERAPTVTVDGFSISFQLPSSVGIAWKNQCCICCRTDTLRGFTSPKQIAPKNSHRTAQCFPDQRCVTGTTSSSHCQAGEIRTLLPQVHVGLKKRHCVLPANMAETLGDHSQKVTGRKGAAYFDAAVVPLCILLLPQQKREALARRHRLHFDPKLFVSKGHPTPCYGRERDLIDKSWGRVDMGEQTGPRL